MRNVSLLFVAGVTFGLLLPTVAHAALAGNPGYSGTLSSNAGIKKQQLICDPTDPTVGSTSTSYDPRFVKLTRVDAWLNDPMGFDGYFITSALVEVDISGGNFRLVSVPVGQTFDVPNQTGYVQIRYQGTITGGATGVTGPPPGYDFRAQAGVVGQNTHALIFDVFPTVPESQVLSYTNFAHPGGKQLDTGGFSQPDRLTNQNGQTVGPGTGINIAPATVAGPLVPEPATAALLAAAVAGFLASRPRRKSPQRELFAKF